ncbi:hypothetical protein A4X13_0g6121 [Tilletia indica]|uniref:Uncharacterized protein n=1 Tax=Tilletia indica TaxID=43049 RepID=A0A177TIE2_9BASI|nr:hypothetical protein A4X13_0g6121 [Tilletia indica]
MPPSPPRETKVPTLATSNVEDPDTLPDPQTPRASNFPTTITSPDKSPGKKTQRATRSSTFWNWSPHPKDPLPTVGAPVASKEREQREGNKSADEGKTHHAASSSLTQCSFKSLKSHPSRSELTLSKHGHDDESESFFSCEQHGMNGGLTSPLKPSRTDASAPKLASNSTPDGGLPQTGTSDIRRASSRMDGLRNSTTGSEYAAFLTDPSGRLTADSDLARSSACLSVTASSGHQSSATEIVRGDRLDEDRSLPLPMPDREVTSLDRIQRDLVTSSDIFDVPSTPQPAPDTDIQGIPAQRRLSVGPVLRKTVSNLMRPRTANSEEKAKVRAHPPSSSRSARLASPQGPPMSFVAKVRRFSTGPKQQSSVVSAADVPQDNTGPPAADPQDLSTSSTAKGRRMSTGPKRRSSVVSAAEASSDTPRPATAETAAPSLKLPTPSPPKLSEPLPSAPQGSQVESHQSQLEARPASQAENDRSPPTMRPVSQVSHDSSHRRSGPAPSTASWRTSSAVTVVLIPSPTPEKRQRVGLFSKMKSKLFRSSSNADAESTGRAESVSSLRPSVSTQDAASTRTRLSIPNPSTHRSEPDPNPSTTRASSMTAIAASREVPDPVPRERKNRRLSSFVRLLGSGKQNQSANKASPKAPEPDTKAKQPRAIAAEVVKEVPYTPKLPNAQKEEPAPDPEPSTPTVKRRSTIRQGTRKDGPNGPAEASPRRVRSIRKQAVPASKRPASCFVVGSHERDYITDLDLQNALAALERSQMALAKVVKPPVRSAATRKGGSVGPLGASQSGVWRGVSRPTSYHASMSARNNPPPSRPPTMDLPPTPPMVRDAKLARNSDAGLGMRSRPSTAYGDMKPTIAPRFRTQSLHSNGAGYPHQDLLAQQLSEVRASTSNSTLDSKDKKEGQNPARMLDPLRTQNIDVLRTDLTEMHDPSPTFLAAIHDPFQTPINSSTPSISSTNIDASMSRSASAGLNRYETEEGHRRRKSELDMQKIKLARELAHSIRSKELGKKPPPSSARHLAQFRRQSMNDLSTRAGSSSDAPAGMSADHPAVLSHVQRRRLRTALPLLLTHMPPMQPLPPPPPVPPGQCASEESSGVQELPSPPSVQQPPLKRTARVQSSNDSLSTSGSLRAARENPFAEPTSPRTGPSSVEVVGMVEATSPVSIGPARPRSIERRSQEQKRVTFAIEEQSVDEIPRPEQLFILHTPENIDRSNESERVAADRGGSHSPARTTSPSPMGPRTGIKPFKTRADLAYRSSSSTLLRSKYSSGGLSTVTATHATLTAGGGEAADKSLRHTISHRSMDVASLLHLRSQLHPPVASSSSSISIARRASNPILLPRPNSSPSTPLRRPLLLPQQQSGRLGEGSITSSPDGSESLSMSP